MKNFITEDENTLQGGPLWAISRHVYKIYLCKRYYHNPSLGFVTKARACKGAGQECNMGVTFTLLGVRESVRE